ncbi:MAG TPA: dienelactone hydrolase family protein [Streptosporangiaceae bacterium]|nr:dienelactone hydrolase family protein [Streptosporangiaceae bacterium]
MRGRCYDPFRPGESGVGVLTTQARDFDRDRVFPCEVWYPAAADPGSEQREAPAAPGRHPLIVFSHYSFGNRRRATFLCRHLASHGYVVAAMDHSECVVPEMTGRPGETSADRAARIQAIIASRVPDVRFLLGYLLDGEAAGLAGIGIDPGLVGVAGHSFGGWTALAASAAEPRFRAVVALAPGGGSHPRPGVLPLPVPSGWQGELPVLILTGDHDVPVPLDAVLEVFESAPAPKRMFVLRRADHQHFADDVEESHEALRAMTLPAEAAWLTAEMLPVSELCPAEHAHLFTRGLALAHLDAALRRDGAAQAFLGNSAEAALAASGIDAYRVAVA